MEPAALPRPRRKIENGRLGRKRKGITDVSPGQGCSRREKGGSCRRDGRPVPVSDSCAVPPAGSQNSRRLGWCEEVRIRSVKSQLVFFVATGMLSLGTVAFCLGGAEEDEWVRRGRELAAAGRIDEALEVYVAWRRKQPNDPGSYLASVRLLLDANRRRDAEAEAAEALRLRRLSPAEAVELARLTRELGNPVAAAEVLERIEPRESLGWDGLLLLARLYREQRRFAEALQVLEEAERLAGGAGEEVFFERGVTLLEQGALERSMEAFEAVVARRPRMAEAYHGLSRVCLFGNNPEAALRMATEAVRLKPENSLFLFQLGVAYKALGRFEEAAAALRRADREGADTFSIAFELGDVLRRLGDRRGAQEQLERYRRLLEEKRRRQEVQQWEEELEAAVQQSRIAAALEAARHILERDPNHWTAHNRAAKIYLARRDAEAAAPHVRALLQLEPEASESHLLAALWAQHRGRPEEALAEALEARRLRPGDAAVRNLLGNLYYQRGNLAEAVEEYRAAAELAPEETVYRANLRAVERRLNSR